MSSMCLWVLQNEPVGSYSLYGLLQPVRIVRVQQSCA